MTRAAAGGGNPFPAAVAFSLLLTAVGGLAWLHPRGLAGPLAADVRSLGPATLAVGLVPLALALGAWTARALAAGAGPDGGGSGEGRAVRLGMVGLILSEVMFFAALFWGYLHFALDPAIAGLTRWPPAAIRPDDAWGGPLVNTLVLLASGAAVASAHHGLARGRDALAVRVLLVGVALAATFLALQAREFLLASFGYRDGVYPSVFFLAVGFHGLHVLIGAVLLGVCLVPVAARAARPTYIAGFDAVVWYWHFVDAVWLVLFFVLYVAAGAGLFAWA